jgi:hypothetical protein
MKPLKVLSVVLISLFLAASCKKNQEPTPESTGGLSGKWKWIDSWLDAPLSDSNPRTPKNTGFQEEIEFKNNHTWIKSQNNILTDSGTFSTGHGSYTPYAGAYTYIYDSIVYYHHGLSEKGTQDYYKISNDTLMFCGCFAGFYAKADATEGASKRFIKRQ